MNKWVSTATSIFSMLLVGSFIYSAMQNNQYKIAAGLIIVFLLLAKFTAIDKLKLTKTSIEAEDKHESKHK